MGNHGRDLVTVGTLDMVVKVWVSQIVEKCLTS
jgi:hypothetical protein